MKTTVKILDNLVTLLDGRKEAHKNYMESMGYNWDEPITMKIGKKYAKLITGTSVTAFIDLDNGNIYKPAGWAKPAPHARGNINSDLNGAEAFDSTGFVKYLR